MRPALGMALALALAVASGGSADAMALDACAAAKVKCVGRAVKSLLGCHQKAESKGLTVSPDCVQKASDKLTGCFAKADGKFVCSPYGHGAAFQAELDAYVLDVVQALDPGYPTPIVNRCSAGKKKAVGAATAAKLGCHAKALARAPGILDPACLAKAEAKLSAAWAKLEAKPPCLTTGDAAALQAEIDAFVVAVTEDPPPTCNNGVNDPGEPCDASAPSAGWGACAPEFACVDCQCSGSDCPTRIAFSIDAADPASILDIGGGFWHRSPALGDGDVTVDLTCGTSSRPCGTCNVSGPVANTGANQLDGRRCSNDTSVSCTTDVPCGRHCVGGSDEGEACADASECSGGGACPPAGTCEYFFGYQPFAASGMSACVANQFDGPVSGTANVESGEAAIGVRLTSRVHGGGSIDGPCPRCVGDTYVNDGVESGGCDGGLRNGKPCDANGSVPGRPDYGSTSLDCPPSPGSVLATWSFDLATATDPVTKTLSGSSPSCSGELGERCLCDTCNDGTGAACDSDDDCLDPPGPIGPICGGKRCSGGVSVGMACAVDAECPGGSCGRPGEPTRPSYCWDDTATPGVLDCVDPDGDGEGECTVGPIVRSCSLVSGHAQRFCTSDGDCGGVAGSCQARQGLCFLTGGFSGKNGTNTLIAEGMEELPVSDASNPTLGAVFCVPPTTSSSINSIVGLPGPARVTIKGTAIGLP